jgi:hypothetical protein
MIVYELTLLLPEGIVIFPKVETIIDLIWGNKKIEEGIVKYQITRDNDHISDHLSVEIILNLHPESKKDEDLSSLNYIKTDWKVFKVKVSIYLSSIIDPRNPTPEVVDQYTSDLTIIVLKVVLEIISRKRSSSFSKR